MYSTPRIKKTYGRRKAVATPPSSIIDRSWFSRGDSGSKNDDDSKIESKDMEVEEKEDEDRQPLIEETPQTSDQSNQDPWKMVENISSAPRKKLNLVSNEKPSRNSSEDKYYHSSTEMVTAFSNKSTTNGGDDRSNSPEGESQEEIPTAPSTPSRGVKRAKAPTYASTAKRTYGERRTYDDSKNTGSPTTEQEPKLTRHADSGDSENDDDEDDNANVRDANELSTIGTNSQFLEELQFSIEGLRGDLNMKRITLIEIAEKIRDKEFVNKMKTTYFPGVLFTEATKVDDSYCSFVLGIIIARSFEAGVGLAVSMISDFSIADYLVDMLLDIEDIREIVKKQKLSKAVQLSLDELINGDDCASIFMGLETVSRCSIALRALRALESHGQIMPFVREALAPFTGKFIDLLRKLVSYPKDETNLRLIHLLVTHLEFMLNGESVESTLELCEAQTPNPMYNLVEMCKEFFTSKQSSAEVSTIITMSIIQLFIVTTSNLKLKSNHGKELYDSELAEILINHFQSNDSDYSDLELFCWGLLVNLTESQRVCKDLIKASKETILTAAHNRILDTELLVGHNNSNIEEASVGKQFDCQGYQCLTFGQIACVDDTDQSLFTKKELRIIKKGLDEFEKVVKGPGLQIQVAETSKQLYNLLF